MSAYQRQPKQASVTCPHCQRIRIMFEDEHKRMPAAARAYVWLRRHIRAKHGPLTLIPAPIATQSSQEAT